MKLKYLGIFGIISLLSYTAMVTKTVYNVLLNRYDEVSISTEPVTLNNAIKQVARK